MTVEPKRNPKAGGSLIALSTLAGAAIGFWQGEPSLGVVLGAISGVALAAIVWLVDKRRAG